MKIIAKLCLLFVFLGFFVPYSSAKLTQRDALPNMNIKSFAQDNLGYVWIATANGLCKCYGDKYDVYYSDSDSTSLPSNIILDIFIDKKSDLWIATDRGVCKMLSSDGRFKRLRIRQLSGAEGFCHGFISLGDRIFSYGLNGLFEVDDTGNAFVQRFDVKGGIVNSAVIDDRNMIWISAGTELICLNSHCALVSRTPVPAALGPINSMVMINGSVYVGTETGMYRVDSRTITFEPVSLGQFGQPRINRLVFDHKHTLLICTKDRGLIAYDVSKRKVLQNDVLWHNLGTHDITTAFIDSEGNLWIGSFDRGMTFVSSREGIFNFDSYLASAFRNKFVTRIAEDKFGNKWVGTRYDGFFCVNEAQQTIHQYDMSTVRDLADINSNFVQEIICDHKNRLWIGYSNSLLVLQPNQNGTFSVLRRFNNIGNVVTAAVDSRGRVWAGLSENGIYVFDENLDIVKNLTSSVANSNNVTCIMNFGDGKMLFSAFLDNIYVIDIDSYVATVLDSKYQADWAGTVTIMLDDNKKNLWFGTYGNGLLHYNLEKHQLVHYSTENGLLTNDAVAIASDKDGNVWMGSSYGLYCITPTTHRVRTYLASDGAVGNQYHEKSVFRDASNHIYFGGNTGLDDIMPWNLIKSARDIPVHITSLRVFDKPLRVGDGILDKDISMMDNIQLQYNQNSIRISFYGICYYAKGNLEYAYRLVGFDKSWNYLRKHNEAIYTNLPYGKYEFEVMVKDNNGEWGQPKRLTTIEIGISPWLHPLAILVYIVILAFLVAVVNRIYLRYKLEKERYVLAEQLLENERDMSRMKITFFTNISHELRTPLTLIYGPVKKLQRACSRFGDEEISSNIDYVAANVDRLLALIGQLLKFKDINDTTLPLQVAKHDCVKQVSEIIRMYNVYAAEKDLDIQFAPCAESYLATYDADKLDKILNNLLINATKYTPQGGRIIVKLDVVTHPEWNVEDSDYDYMQIQVIDNGIGIAKSELSKVFTRFKRLVSGADNIEGFGIGLNFVQQLVKNHRGFINAMRNEFGGTTFIVDLPVSDVAYSDNERLSESDAEEEAATQDAPETDVDDEQPAEIAERMKVLVVEDNVDMNRFICGLLSPKYDVESAFDGEEGLAKAMEELPDMIISDVLMPKLDGFSLCSRVKNDKDVCHIPVILLTAKTMERDQIKGFKCGADAYLTKPFNPDLFLTIVDNLFEKILRQKAVIIGTSAGNIDDEKELEISPLDREFLNKLYKYIEENMSNDQLNVNLLGRELGFSRTNFYRKIKALTGVTPNDLLRMYRLNRAAELILKREYMLNEISEMTGFGTQSHFSSLFKRHFGVSPKDYIDYCKNKSANGSETIAG